MSLPNVTISKSVSTTGQAPPGSIGVLAIVAASSTGSVNTPGGFSRTDSLIDEYGYGPLAEFAAYNIQVANQPVLAIKGNATFTGAYGSVTKVAASGTATVVAGATEPLGDYDVLVTVTTGGTAGTDSIQFTYSLDGGQTTSGIKATGASTTLSIPNSGVSFTLGSVWTAGDTFSVFTRRPQLNNTDVTDSLTALGNTKLPFEGVLVDCSANSSTVGLIDTILSGWEGRGVFKFFLINSRYKTEPEPDAETETAYATSLSALFGSQTSIRGCVGADGGHVASTISGFNIKQPTALFLAARAMSIPIGEDPAYVARGPVTGVQISDPNGNPLDHDEDIYPNLDSLRLVSLRSFSPGGPQGVYITNANSIQPSGGSYPYLQHIRIVNRACEIAWSTLTTQLSVSVQKNLKPDPLTGIVTIYEPDAARIDDLVNEALFQPLKGQVSAYKFQLSRSDDMNAVPCIVNADLNLVALAYIKGFRVKAQFVKTISTTI